MPRSKKKNIDDTSKLSALRRDIAEELKKRKDDILNNSQTNGQINPQQSGLYNTHRPDINLKYASSPNEKVIREDGAYITFGADKPSGTASGYGGKGATGAARIDLVVGRHSMFNPPDGSKVDNSFQADAARIYISQLTDIDANFGIDPGKTGYMKARSGIGIKADGVRIIGREGVKIVTGRMQGTGEKNSQGGKLLPAPMIELIAGNNTERRKIPGSFFGGDDMEFDPLQGVAMGENVVMAFKDLMFLLEDVIGVVRKDKNNNRIFNIAVAGAGALPPPAAGPIIAAAQAFFAVKDIETNLDLWKAALDATMFDVNYLQPFGYRYLESRNVKAT